MAHLLALPLRSPLAPSQVMKGYNNLPKKTSEDIDDAGYFHTGDIGKMEAGFVYILDRMKASAVLCCDCDFAVLCCAVLCCDCDCAVL